jgi:hypothetical protein
MVNLKDDEDNRCQYISIEKSDENLALQKQLVGGTTINNANSKVLWHSE